MRSCTQAVEPQVVDDVGRKGDIEAVDCWIMGGRTKAGIDVSDDCVNVRILPDRRNSDGTSLLIIEIGVEERQLSERRSIELGAEDRGPGLSTGVLVGRFDIEREFSPVPDRS